MSVAVYRDSPHVPLLHHGGQWWTPHEVPRWISLGYCPEPADRWSTIRYHVLHGLLMGYPLRAVLTFAWRHRHSFGNDESPPQTEV